MLIHQRASHGTELVVDFVKRQNDWIHKHQRELQRNIPEIWDAKLGGLHSLTWDDWVDLCWGYDTLVNELKIPTNPTMESAARNLKDMVFDHGELFMRQMNAVGKSNDAHTYAWKFLMNLRETINEFENYDPMLGVTGFNKLFEVQ